MLLSIHSTDRFELEKRIIHTVVFVRTVYIMYMLFENNEYIQEGVKLCPEKENDERGHSRKITEREGDALDGETRPIADPSSVPVPSYDAVAHGSTGAYGGLSSLWDRRCVAVNWPRRPEEYRNRQVEAAWRSPILLIDHGPPFAALPRRRKKCADLTCSLIQPDCLLSSPSTLLCTPERPDETILDCP